MFASYLPNEHCLIDNHSEAEGLRFHSDLTFFRIRQASMKTEERD